ncbi:copper-binding protein [Noviherbaspirillum soli]|uniref:copper-binding protein n=1 Tax=Noviherbaspirillum soli TaxID=1064518 RepID=UPI00188AF01C|nr:copper-binding protein [Noviherbaspirillum soli]
MKTFAIASILIALSSSIVVFAQDNKMSDMDMKKCMNMKGMDMKGMAMKGMKDMDMKSCMEMMNQRGETKSTSDAGNTDMIHKATGVIKNVEPQKGTVTLAHGPVESLKWPAMTMGFSVRDKALLDKMSVGKSVNVEFVKEGANYVITKAY